MADTALAEELVVTTLNTYVKKGKTFDNIFAKNTLVNYLMGKDSLKGAGKKGKRVKLIEPGKKIEVDLEYGKGGNWMGYDGLDEVETKPNEIITNALYDPKFLTAFVTLLKTELIKRGGNTTSIIKYLSSRMSNAERAGREYLGDQLYAATPASKEMNSFASLIKTAGTGTVGGINAGTAANSWWKNKFKAGAATTIDEVVEIDVLTLYNDCCENSGEDKPDLILTDQTGYQYLMRYVMSKSGYYIYDKALYGKIGLRLLSVFDMNVIWDSRMPDQTGNGKVNFFVINTEFLSLYIFKNDNFVVGDKVDMLAGKQHAIGFPITATGNLVVSNRAKQGVLYDVATGLS